jgi:zinc/manganese transport system substrate-binding protein
MNFFFNFSSRSAPMVRIRFEIVGAIGSERRAGPWDRPVSSVEELLMTVMKTAACVLAVAISLIAPTAHAQNKLNVITTTEDLASIAREVGGDRVTVESISRGYQDPHFVEAKPSFILKLQKADLLVTVGRELEIGWLPPLIQQSRNAKVQVGANGYLDASGQARILDIPQGQITRAMGDVHPLGNPHYWLDPENGKVIAKEISDKLSQLRPNDRAFFEQRLNDFVTRLSDAEKRWAAMMAPYKGTKVVTYHRSFPNFAERFGLDVIGYVEPRPGIPPTPQHTLDLINEMKRQNVPLVLVEPYFDLKTPNSIGRETGAQVLVMPPSVGGVKDVTDYFKLFDYDINLVIGALKKVGAASR